METTCLLDLEDDDDSSTCSSFTIATVLSRIKNETSLMQQGSSFDDRTAYIEPNIIADKSLDNQSFMVMMDGIRKRNETTDRDDELQRLRCTSSLMDDSFDSTVGDDTKDNIHQNETASTPAAASSSEDALECYNNNVNLQKTVKKSNCNRSTNSNLGKIFRITATDKDTAKKKSSATRLQDSTKVDNKAASFEQPPVPAPYDETSNNSFDASIGNSLLDTTYDSFDELDKEGIKRRKRQNNKFLSVYDDISAQVIQRSSTFESSLHKKHKSSKVKRMGTAFSTAVQIIADSISSHAAAEARCDVGGSWGDNFEQSLSGKKRPSTEISGLQHLIKSWDVSHNYIQIQLMAEREEERKIHIQQLKNCNAQIKYLQHENLKAYETVTLARTESESANDSRGKLALERDALKQQIDDSQKECRTMKEAMLALAEAEKHRVKTINKLERKLQRAKKSLERVSALAKNAEDEASTLRGTIQKLQAENKSLSSELRVKKEYIENECNKQNEKLMTAKKEAKKWQLQVEENGIEIKMLQMNPASRTDITCSTPNPNGITEWGLINSFGAEDITVGSELFNQQTFAEKQPIQTALMSPPGKSSRQLSYASDDKENQPNGSSPLLIHRVRCSKQQKCCLCFRDPAGVMKSCQCGQKDCNKRAHITCLSKHRNGNVSSCVSHPGTPNPPMPLILCTGIWKE